MSAVTSFYIRASISISRFSGPIWWGVDPLGNIIPVAGVNAPIFTIIQFDSNGAVLYHQIKFGCKYIGLVGTGLGLVDKPYSWYFVSQNNPPPTRSTVDLLTNQQYFMATNNNTGIYYADTNKITISQLNLITEKLENLEYYQSQPLVSASRYLATAHYSPAPSASTIYNVDGGLTVIDGFNAGTDGQQLTIYATGNGTIQVNNLSPNVLPSQQIVTPGGGPTTSPANGTFQFIYNGNSMNWILLTQIAAQSGSTISLANGSAINPSLSFSGDSTTGIFRQNADVGVIRFTAEGTEVVDITTDGIQPAADSAQLLGTNSLGWRQAFINQIQSTNSNTISLASNLVPASGLLTIGDATVNGTLASVSTAAVTNSNGPVGITGATTVTITSSNNTVINSSSGINLTSSDPINLNASDNVNISAVGNITLNPTASVVPFNTLTTALGNASAVWSVLYADNWFFGGLSTNPFIENNTLTPAIQSVTTPSTFAGLSTSASWYRIGYMVFATGNISWTSITPGTGPLVINSAIPSAYHDTNAANGTPGTISYNLTLTTTGNMSVVTTSTPGQLALLLTLQNGNTAAVAVTGVNAATAGSIVYNISYSTNDLS